MQTPTPAPVPSPPEILAQIRARQATSQPLNLSAVKEEAPELLAGLWDPAQFKGWRQRLDEAGVSYENIRFTLSSTVACPICDFRAINLGNHLRSAHSVGMPDVRKTYPLAEGKSEELRATQFGNHHGQRTREIAPHWEKTWSREYALDRLRWLYDHGHQVNYSYFAKHEPSLAAFLRHRLGSWDAALAAVGLSPDEIRLAVEGASYTREEVAAELRRIHQEAPLKIHLDRSRTASLKTLVAAAFREFHTYEAALEAAGIDPLPLVPALGDPAMLARRDQLLALMRKRHRARTPYDPVEVSAILREQKPVILAFWGSWEHFATAQGWEDKELFNPPSHTKYHSEQAIITAIQARRQHQLPLREADVRMDNSPLLLQANRQFGNWTAALQAAGVERPPAMIDHRSQTPESLLVELKALADAGTLMWTSTFGKQGSNILLKWAIRYYGSWRNALAAAGIPRPKRPRPAQFPLQEFMYPTAESALTRIRARAAEGAGMMQGDLAKPKPEGGECALLQSAKKHFGSWPAAVVASGIGKPGDRMSRTRFRSREDLIVALKRRLAEGLPVTTTGLRLGPRKDHALVNAIGKHFSSHQEALAAAGVVG